MEETHNGLIDTQVHFVRLSVALGAGCGIWTGVSHSVFSFRVQKAVQNIVSIDERETGLLGLSGPADSPRLDRVNLFEYLDIVTIGLNVTAVASLSLACLLWYWGAWFFFLLCWALEGINFFSGPSPFVWHMFAVSFVLWCGCYVWLIYRSGIVGRFRRLREACRTRPSYTHVQALVLLSSTLYAVCLRLIPLPSLWCWSLITAHTARAIKVWNSVDGQSGVVEAQGQFSGDRV